MPAPPKDVPAKELFLQLCEPAPSEVIDFPRKNRQTGKPITRVRIMVVPQIEHERAQMSARKSIMDRYQLKAGELEDKITREVAGDAIARELLVVACRHESPMPGTEDSAEGPQYPRLFRDAAHVSELTAHEIMVLFNAYLAVQEKYGPFESHPMTPDDIDNWVKRLVEGGSELPLLSTTFPQLVQLSYLLAERTYSLSQVLATQLQNSPPTSGFTLPAYCGDIYSFGRPAENSESTGSESSDSLLADVDSISTEDAIELARKLVLR